MVSSRRSRFLLVGASGFVLAATAVVGAPAVIRGLFSTGFFMPHSHCYLNNPQMLWLQGLSDFLIGASYMLIAGVLVYLVPVHSGSAGELHAPAAQVRVEGQLPRVRGDAASITQCFSNLVGNAVKFVGQGVTPEVVIRGEIVGARARVWVIDNGIGIAPEATHKIFEAFQRLHSRDAYEGTGIGLAIVRKAVERIGGQVGVAS